MHLSKTAVNTSWTPGRRVSSAFRLVVPFARNTVFDPDDDDDDDAELNMMIDDDDITDDFDDNDDARARCSSRRSSAHPSPLRE